MLKTAENEHYDRQEDSEMSAKTAVYGLVALCRYEHKHTAEECQYEKAEQRIAHFDFAKFSRLFTDACRARAEDKSACDRCADQIAQPYNSEIFEITRLTLDRVADFACVKIKSKTEYHEQSHTEKRRTYVPVIAGKVDYAAHTYHKPCGDCPQKCVY